MRLRKKSGVAICISPGNQFRLDWIPRETAIGAHPEKLAFMRVCGVLQGRLNKKFQEDLQKLTDERDKVIRKCMDELRAKRETADWTATRFSLSLGDARMARDVDGARFGLGKAVTFNGTIKVNDRSAVNFTVRRTSDALDADTLSKPTQIYKNSTLAGLRYTFENSLESPLRGIVELSNAKTSAGEATADVFKYAVGIDKKVTKGIWVSFRLGRNRSEENGKEQTSGILKFDIQPSLLPWN